MSTKELGINVWTEKIYMDHRHPHKPPLAPSQVTYYLQDPFSHSQILQCSGPSVWPAAQLQSWMLQSSAMDLLSFPCSNLHTFGDRAFSVVPPLWNSLPSKFCSAQSTDLFQKLLKTHLFPLVCLYSFIKHSGLPWTALYKSKLYYYYKKWKGKKKETGCIPHLPKLFGFLEGFQASLKH